MSDMDDNVGDPAPSQPGLPSPNGPGAAPIAPPQPGVTGPTPNSNFGPGDTGTHGQAPRYPVPPPRAPSVSTPHISTVEETFDGVLPPIDTSPESTGITWDDPVVGQGPVDELDDDAAPTLRPAEQVAANIQPDAGTPDRGEIEDYDEEDDPHIGSTVGERYVIDGVLGEGGMGRVYLAHHKVIGKKMAIKILHAELAKDKEAVKRFVREARAASSIGNPHIVDISDFGETDDGSTYFVMEHLDGYGLDDMIEERKSLPTDVVCDVALQMCDGLAAAHRQDIVHRDLKPENVTLITQGSNDRFCKILDFGIAKVSTGQSATKLTMAGAVFGTPHYMSPEQAAGAAVDHRTDIYSLGVILYEMTSGNLPFNADNFMGILTQHMYRAPVPIRAIVGAPDCDPGLEALILKCLSKKPDARYQSMDELADDLRKYQADGIPVAVQEMMARSGSFNVPADYFKSPAPAVVPGTPHGPRKRMGPRYVAIAGVAAAVLVVLLVLMRNSTTTAETTSRAPEPAPKPKPTATQQTAKASAPKKVPVLVYAIPTSAIVILDGKEIKLPETFPVAKGGKVELDVRAKGYVTETLTLDGSVPKVKVQLEKKEDPKTKPTAQPKTRRPVRPKGKGKGKSKGGGDYVDPWSQ